MVPGGGTMKNSNMGKGEKEKETNQNVRNREVDESPRDSGTESEQSGVRVLAKPVAPEGPLRSAARETHARAHHGRRWMGQKEDGDIFDFNEYVDKWS